MVSRLLLPTIRPVQTRFRFGCGSQDPNLAGKSTRRFIMQKARRHSIKLLRPLVGAWFQGLFHSLFEVLFTFPSQYWFAIGLSGVFSLTGWSRQIHARFLVSRATQDTTRVKLASYTGLSPSMTELSRSFYSLTVVPRRGPTTPYMP